MSNTKGEMSMHDLSQEEQAENLYQRSLDAFSHGHHQECLTLLDQAIALDAHNYRFHSMRGDLYYEMRRYADAVASYTQAIALHPDDIDARINGGVAYEKLHDWEHALILYDEAIVLRPTEVIAHYNRGDTLRHLGRLEEAVAAYTQAIHVWPEFAWSYLNRANILSQLGRHDEALADYNHAYALDPDDSNIAWTVSWLRFGRSGLQTQEAERLLVIADLPDRGQPYLSFLCRAVVALQRSDVPGALAYLEQASASDFEEQWDTPFWIGIVKAMQGETEPACQSIDCALARGLPPLLLHPLYWLQSTTFFDLYARDILQRFGM